MVMPVPVTEERMTIVAVPPLLNGSSLTAVELFSHRQEKGSLHPSRGRYQELLPATEPGPGQQFAFEVNLDQCTACKACVAACHSLNGLEEGEAWRSTGLLIGGTAALPFQQTVTTSCHHCVEPACLNGCPVNAYEKDARTGIVKHLDDQCIGCKYCTLTCPYDVPVFSKVKGIVRKCDMCSDRLGAGEAPACVQACPNEAISIKVVDVADVVARSDAGAFLPAAPSPDITMPTTSFVSEHPLPTNLLPADYHALRREAPEWPLVLMLVLTQASVGLFLVALTVGHGLLAAGSVETQCAAGIGWLAILASMFHLGRPRYAFRAVLGLRHSWLSREILAMGLYVAILTALAWPIPALPWGEGFSGLVRVVVALGGAATLLCSINVYAVTRRVLWRGSITSFKFLSTALLLGAPLLIFVSSYCDRPRAALAGRLLIATVVLVAAVKLLQEGLMLLYARDRRHSPQRRAADLLLGTLRPVLRARLVLLALGGLAAPFLFGSIPWLIGCSVFCLLVGEVLERYLYFTTGVASRMPGGQAV